MTKKPTWLKVRHKANYDLSVVENLMKDMSLHTVCDEAMCPNRTECYGNQTATFMIMGKACSRQCKFCNVNYNEPKPLDQMEPYNLGKAVEKLKLKHVVVTSVTRDDLADGGAEHFSKVIYALKGLENPPVIEVLIPDLKGDEAALRTIIDARPDVIGHNIETIERLYDQVRPEALYRRSLGVLKTVKYYDSTILTKSGLMLGLGETKAEVKLLLEDLRKQECDFVTIGQYLAPSDQHVPVFEYIEPQIFDHYWSFAYSIGFKHVASGPLVRSSYMAHEAIENSHM